jgi:hypothetical protein
LIRARTVAVTAGSFGYEGSIVWLVAAAIPWGVETLLVTVPSPVFDGSRDRIGREEEPNGLAASTVGDDLPPLPVRVAALLLVLMKLGRKELRGEVGEVGPCPGVGRGVPPGDLPPLKEALAFGIGICVGRELARDISARV